MITTDHAGRRILDVANLDRPATRYRIDNLTQIEGHLIRLRREQKRIGPNAVITAHINALLDAWVATRELELLDEETP